MTPEQKEAQARNRFFALGLIRLAGALMVVFGIIVVAGNRDWGPTWLGYAFVVLGFVDLAFLPRLLLRRWRSPPGQ